MLAARWGQRALPSNRLGNTPAGLRTRRRWPPGRPRARDPMKTACLVWHWQGKSAGELSSSAPAYSPVFGCQGWHGSFVLAPHCLFRPFIILHSSFFLRPRVSLPPLLHSTFCILPSPPGVFGAAWTENGRPQGIYRKIRLHVNNQPTKTVNTNLGLDGAAVVRRRPPPENKRSTRATQEEHKSNTRGTQESNSQVPG